MTRLMLRKSASMILRKLTVWKFNVRDFIDSYLTPSLAGRRTPYGFLFSGSNSVHHKAMQAGQFERLEVDWLLARLDSVDVFVDVGANAGYFTCIARARDRRVVAVEPHYRNLQYLLENIDQNLGPPVEIFPVALSDRPGVMRLYGLSSTGASLLPNWAGSPSALSRKVPVTTLDNLLEGRFAGERLLVKIDVEGHEHEVILGAQATLGRSTRPTWLVEITDSQFHPGGANPNIENTFWQFWGRGYRCHALTARGLEPIDCAAFAQVHAHQAAGIINYIFSDRESTGRGRHV